jgi:SAM-dependent methyltransferase
MGIIGGSPAYHLLRRIGREGKAMGMDGSVYLNKSKLEVLLGQEFWREIEGRSVIDFGCGAGAEAIEMALHGARKVVGIDIQERLLEEARQAAARADVADRCSFATRASESADVIVAIDSFEHFENPSAILRVMRDMLKDKGCIIAAFGPTWYHPLGGHLFSVFPWAHLLFTEKALIRWRSDFKRDGATRFHEVEGGLNKMTIRRFERMVAESPFRFDRFEAVPIRKLRPLANRLTREMTTAIVRCKLVPK